MEHLENGNKKRLRGAQENAGRNALFFDVDGTLMDEHGIVPQSARDAIHAARENGALVFINSGRPYALAKAVDGLVEYDGLLCGCGTDLRIGGKQLYSHLLPAEGVHQLQQTYADYGVDAVLEGPEGDAFGEKNRLKDTIDMKEFIRGQDALSVQAFDDPDFPANKFCILTDEKSRTKEFLESIAWFTDPIDRGEGFYECPAKGHNKGQAVQTTVELLGLDPARTYAFGDSMNDVAMLEAVRHPVIMAQHDKPLEALCEYVTDGIHEDGIANALKHYGLI